MKRNRFHHFSACMGWLLLPVLVTVLCAGIVLLCSICPYEQAKPISKWLSGRQHLCGGAPTG